VTKSLHVAARRDLRAREDLRLVVELEFRNDQPGVRAEEFVHLPFMAGVRHPVPPLLDAAMRANLPVIDNRAIGIHCYSPAYTFVEKLQTVSTKFQLQQEATRFPKNFLRHYYDIYCLLASPEVQDFIGTPTYHNRKVERFRTGDNLHIASNEAFLLSDPAVRSLYETKYRETAALYYAGQVPFSAILERIAQHLDRL